jgi:Lrp/AsnC family leucine-responsive transcriptional regulator
LDIDLKDKKILAELDKDARQTYSQIAKRVGLSQQVVSYRVQRLLNNGVIKSFLTFINLEKLNHHIFNICLNLKHMTEEHQQELIERVSKLPHVNWLCTTTGGYDLIIGVNAGDTHQFQFVFGQITSILEHEIVDDGMFICMDSWQLPYPVLPETRKMLVQPDVGIRLDQPVKLQHLDYQILQELAGNARVTNQELARKFKTSISTISYHIDNLIKNRIIMGFKPLLDMSKLDYNWHLVLFKLKYVDAHTRKQFTEFLKSIPQTFFVVHGFGNWDMQAEFYCKDDHEYNQVMNKIFPEKFHNIIKTQKELRVLKEHKCVWYPVGKIQEPVQTSLDQWVKTKIKRDRKVFKQVLIQEPK